MTKNTPRARYATTAISCSATSTTTHGGQPLSAVSTSTGSRTVSSPDDSCPCPRAGRTKPADSVTIYYPAYHIFGFLTIRFSYDVHTHGLPYAPSVRRVPSYIYPRLRVIVPPDPGAPLTCGNRCYRTASPAALLLNPSMYHVGLFAVQMSWLGFMYVLRALATKHHLKMMYMSPCCEAR